MQVTILTSAEDVKRTRDREFPGRKRPLAGLSTALQVNSIRPNGVHGRVARKPFAGETGWGIIRAHGNKQTFEMN